jgi:hypothetical protein
MGPGEKGIDRLVQDAIALARAAKPGCSAREAAEMTAGRRFSDAEWQRKGPIWLRNWTEPATPGGARGGSEPSARASPSNEASGNAKPGIKSARSRYGSRPPVLVAA